MSERVKEVQLNRKELVEVMRWLRDIDSNIPDSEEARTLYRKIDRALLEMHYSDKRGRDVQNIY